MSDLVTKTVEEIAKSKDIVPWLFTAVSALAAGVIALFWRIFNGVEKRIEEKVNKETCEKEHEHINPKLHQHAESGHAGEVVE